MSINTTSRGANFTQLSLQSSHKLLPESDTDTDVRARLMQTDGPLMSGGVYVVCMYADKSSR